MSQLADFAAWTGDTLDLLSHVLCAGAFVQGQMLGHFRDLEWVVGGYDGELVYCFCCGGEVDQTGWSRAPAGHTPDCEHVRFIAALEAT